METSEVVKKDPSTGLIYNYVVFMVRLGLIKEEPIFNHKEIKQMKRGPG